MHWLKHQGAIWGSALLITVLAGAVKADVDADFNGDGAVDSADIAAYVSVWWVDLATGRLDADVNGDGLVRPDDVARFIGRWTEAIGAVLRDDGWTSLPPAVDSRMVYVSRTDGSSGNDGLSISKPVPSLAEGIARLRDGYPDQLLLKKGDVWTNEDFGTLRISGRSAAQRLVIASYGRGPRPKIVPARGRSALSRSSIGESKGYLAVVGLHFQAPVKDEYNTNCVIWLGGDLSSSDILFEDCRFTRFFGGVQVQDVLNLVVRRCVFEDICSRVGVGYSPASMYIGRCKNVLVEENYSVNRVFGVVRIPYQQDSMVYIQDDNDGDLTIRRNMLVSKGSQGPIGIAVRSHAVIDYNLFDGMHTAVSVGGQDTPPSGRYPDGTHYHIGGNVILRGVNMTNASGGERGIGIQIAYTDLVGSVVEYNVLSSKAVFGEGAGINFDPAIYGPARNVTVRYNTLYNWSGLHVQRGGFPSASGLVFQQNQVQNPDAAGSENPLGHPFTASTAVWNANTYHSQRALSAWFAIDGAAVSRKQWKQVVEPTAVFAQLSYFDPGRTLAGYAALLGHPATTDGIIDAILAQSRETWNPDLEMDAVLNYFRAGFFQ